MTAQGHPGAIFKRAIENGNLLVIAEATAREVGNLTLDEALPSAPSRRSIVSDSSTRDRTVVSMSNASNGL